MNSLKWLPRWLYIPSVLFVFLPTIASGQHIITTYAGANWIYPSGPLAAKDAPLGRVSALSTALNGDLLVADGDNALILRLTSSGTATVVAGNGISAYSGDGGPATSASFWRPTAITSDSAGNIYVADLGPATDQSQCTIRRISPTGVISTFANCGGTRTSIFSLALDPFGNLFAAGAQRVYKVGANGSLTAYAGSATGCGLAPVCPGPPANTPALSATFGFLNAMAFDHSGNLYISDLMNGLYTLSPAGFVNPLTTGILAQAIALDQAGNLYAVNVAASNSIKKITPSSTVTLAGNGTRTYSGDGGPAVSAGFQSPNAIAVGANGTVYVSDGFRIRFFAQGGQINVFAGNGKFHSAGDGGPAAGAPIYNPTGTAADLAGNLYISESSGWIRKISPNGIITTIAGNGTLASTGDGGPALNAGIGSPRAITVDPNGNIYFVDDANGKIRKVNASGIISSPALPVLPFSPPVTTYTGLAADGAGNLFFSEYGDCTIYRITPAGTASVIAGTHKCGYNGDNIPATRAELFSPFGLATDPAGNLYVADSNNRRIRKVAPDGTISTVASIQGQVGYVAVNSSGVLFAATSGQVFQIVNGSPVLYAGGGGAVPGDGGLATSARLNINQIAVDAAGNLFIADVPFAFGENLEGYRVHEVLQNPPALTIAPARLQFRAMAGGSVTAPQTINVTGSNGLELSLFPNDIWISVSATTVTAPATIQITANPAALSPGIYSTAIPVSSPGPTIVASSIPITLSVTAPAPPNLSAKGGLSFVLSQNSAPMTQAISISNTGGGVVSGVAAPNGAAWLFAAGSFNLSEGASFPLQVTVNPAGLLPGVFYASIPVTSFDGSQTIKIPVTLTVTPATGIAGLTVSQTGLTFTAVAGGNSVPAQTVWMIASGGRTVNWQATTKVIASSGASGNWLSVTPGTGQALVDPGRPSPASVSVNAAGLASGTYEGQVTVNVPGQTSSAIVVVILNVLPVGSAPPSQLSSSGLVFAAPTGSNPGSQEIAISNLSNRTISYVSRLSREAAPWFIHLPSQGSISASQAQVMTVQTDTSSAAEGVNRGAITFLFGDGSVQTTNLLLVNSSGAVKSAGSSICTPTILLGEFTSLQGGSTITSGQPVRIGATLIDDCGTLVNSGSVNAQFDDGEPALGLNPVGNGYWEATWVPPPNPGPVTIQLNGSSGTSVAAVTVNLAQGSTLIPVINPGGIVSAADPLPGGPVAQGGLIAIYGSGFADTTISSAVAPLPPTLGNVQVLLSGQPIPLLFVSPGQIDAIVPYSVPIGTPLSLQIVKGTWQSAPQTIVAVAAQPAMFLLGQFGSAQVAAMGPAGLAIPQSPVKAGDTITIYCEGLGPVTPDFTAGNLSPVTQLFRTVGPVSVSIGGQNAAVVFAGLAPGSVAEYQVNAVVPQGVAAGASVPVSISVGSASSPIGTIAVR